MNYSLFPAFVTHATILVVALSMGLLVYIHDGKSITNRFFFALTASIVGWAIANFFTFYFGLDIPSKNLYYAALSVKMNMVTASLMTIFIALFVYVFPKKESSFSTTQKMILPVASLIYSITGFFVWSWQFDLERVTHQGSIPALLPNLPILPIWATITLTIIVGSCAYLIMKYRKSSAEERVSYLSAVIGLSSTFVLLPLILFLPVVFLGDSRFNYFGPLAYIPIFYGVGYGIFRHKIFNVRLLTTELLILAAIFILFFNIFI